MTAILCRICCVEPCKACANCCIGLCQCFGDCCICFGQCCNSICNCLTGGCDIIGEFCYQPFACCLFASIGLNISALIYGITAIINGGDECGNPLTILLILLFICAIINGIFAYYMYYTINHDPNNPLFAKNTTNKNEMSTTAKACEFCKYDKWFAVYLCFLLFMIAINCTSIVLSSNCSSTIGRGVFWTAILLFIYLGVGLLIMLSYVMVECLKQLTETCCWYILPCCWPFLCIGCCLKWTAEKEVLYQGSKYPAQDYNDRELKTNEQPVIVQQPQNTQVVVHGQSPAQNTSGYGYSVVNQPFVQQERVASNPYVNQNVQQERPPATNPYANQLAYHNTSGANPKPGVLVIQQPPVQNVAVVQGYQEQKQEPGDQSQKVIQYDERGMPSVNKGNLKIAAKEKGNKALGWAAKKMQNLNDKVQQYNEDNVAEGEGN